MSRSEDKDVEKVSAVKEVQADERKEHRREHKVHPSRRAEKLNKLLDILDGKDEEGTRDRMVHEKLTWLEQPRQLHRVTGVDLKQLFKSFYKEDTIDGTETTDEDQGRQPTLQGQSDEVPRERRRFNLVYDRCVWKETRKEPDTVVRSGCLEIFHLERISWVTSARSSRLRQDVPNSQEEILLAGSQAGSQTVDPRMLVLPT